MASNAVVSGPTSRRVAANIERLRKARQLHQKDLSALLAGVGRPMLPTVISKMERGERRIDVDDLVALALALNVSPSTLLLPPTSGSDPVALTERCSVSSRTAWNWAEGQQTAMDEPGGSANFAEPGADPAIPLDAYDREQHYGRQQLAYQALAQPEERRRGTDNSIVRLVRNFAEVIIDLVVPSADSDEAGRKALLRMARRRHASLGFELDEIAESLDRPATEGGEAAPGQQ
ncbi:helix-turn-helix domain-containing protein [Streptacidiphilus sp. PAMC 29251]